MNFPFVQQLSSFIEKLGRPVFVRIGFGELFPQGLVPRDVVLVIGAIAKLIGILGEVEAILFKHRKPYRGHHCHSEPSFRETGFQWLGHGRSPIRHLKKSHPFVALVLPASATEGVHPNPRNFLLFAQSPHVQAALK